MNNTQLPTKTIHIIGLGSSDKNELTLGSLELMRRCKNVYLRTKKHPCAEQLEELGVEFSSFDELYETLPSFDDVYTAIAQKLLNLPETELVYGVPGSPMFYEDSVQKLFVMSGATEHVHLKVYGAVSFLESLFASLRLDGSKPFKVMDALDEESIKPDVNAANIFCQVYSPAVASEIKLKLMEIYSDEAEAILIHRAGSPDETIERVPLYEIDRSKEISYLTTLIIPMQKEFALAAGSFETLVDIIHALRGENGCPWDKAQTHKSLRPYMLEEAYEVTGAIDEEDPWHLYEELGDVLLQVVLHSEIAAENGDFTIRDVLRSISEKMVRRHPKVFSTDEEERNKSWEKIKAEEKALAPAPPSAEPIAPALPALLRVPKVAKALGIGAMDEEALLKKTADFSREKGKAAERTFCELMVSLALLAGEKGFAAESSLDEYLNKMTL